MENQFEIGQRCHMINNLHLGIISHDDFILSINAEKGTAMITEYDPFDSYSMPLDHIYPTEDACEKAMQKMSKAMQQEYCDQIKDIPDLIRFIYVNNVIPSILTGCYVFNPEADAVEEKMSEFGIAFNIDLSDYSLNYAEIDRYRDDSYPIKNSHDLVRFMYLGGCIDAEVNAKMKEFGISVANFELQD